MKMDGYNITDLRHGEVMPTCCAQNLGFYGVSRAAFRHRFCFSCATSFPARICAGENGDFSKSRRSSMAKCGRRGAFFSRKPAPSAGRRWRGRETCAKRGVRQHFATIRASHTYSARGTGRSCFYDAPTTKVTEFCRIASARSVGNCRAACDLAATEFRVLSPEVGPPGYATELTLRIPFGKTRAICNSAGDGLANAGDKTRLRYGRSAGRKLLPGKRETTHARSEFVY